MPATSGHRLDEDVDHASAGQADAPDHLVGDAVGDQLGRVAGEHLAGLLEHGRLDAAARDAPEPPPIVADRHLRPRRAWRGPFDLGDRGDRDPAAIGLPLLDRVEHLSHDARSLASPAGSARLLATGALDGRSTSDQEYPRGPRGRIGRAAGRRMRTSRGVWATGFSAEMPVLLCSPAWNLSRPTESDAAGHSRFGCRASQSWKSGATAP